MTNEIDDPRYVPITEGSPQFESHELDDLEVTAARFPPEAYIERHAHDRPVLAIMLEGSFDLLFDHRALGCPPSTVFTEPGGESHANAVGSDGAHVIVLQPSNDMELLSPCTRMLDRINHFRDGKLAVLGRRLRHELAEPDDVSELAIEALALEVMALAARRSRTRPTGDEPPSWFPYVEEMVHDRFTDKLRIADLADEAGVHPSHLARVFREQYGVPVGRFIRGLRLQWARTQLTATRRPISDIAYEAGFADQSHFTRAFRRATGLPPGRFRGSSGG